MRQSLTALQERGFIESWRFEVDLRPGRNGEATLYVITGINADPTSADYEKERGQELTDLLKRIGADHDLVVIVECRPAASLH